MNEVFKNFLEKRNAETAQERRDRLSSEKENRRRLRNKRKALIRKARRLAGA
jgi:hypothetical protein